MKIQTAKQGKVLADMTVSEIEYVKNNYPLLGPNQLSQMMGVKRVTVYGIAKKYGLKMTSSARGKISSRTNSGRTMSEKTKKAIIKANKKHYASKKCCDCGSEIVRKAKRCRPCAAKARGGKGHNWWNGGVTPLYGAVFKRLYPAWKFPILERDGFACRDCGKTKTTFEVHHIRLFTTIRDKVMAENPLLDPKKHKLLLAELIVKEHRIEDGITLCRKCHEKRHWKEGDELLGNPNANGEDNQQPSRSNVISLVDRKVQRAMGEDITADKPNTSVPRANAKAR